MFRTVLILLLVIVTQSCGKFGLYSYDKGETLAKVGDKELYMSDVDKILKGDMTKSDSTAIIESYIENWVKSQVKIAAAEAALSDSEEEIDELVNQYRTSLITYRYEDNVVNRSLDTTVTREQITKYYADNRDNFRLAGPIVKAAVVRLPTKLRLGRKFEEMFKSPNAKNWQEFEAICQKNNYRLDDYSNDWTDFTTVVAHIPFTSSNFDEFLKSKQYYEVEDDQYKYMMKILSYRPTSDFSPAEREYNNIRKIIINSRRAELIRNLEDSLMRVANQNNTIQINHK